MVEQVDYVQSDSKSVQSGSGRPSWPKFGTPPIDFAFVTRLSDFVNARLDLADHQLLLLLKTIFECRDDFSEVVSDAVQQAVCGFHYSFRDPGTDSMNQRSESHQLVFATCEYLAGIAYPDLLFKVDGRRGKDKAQLAAKRLGVWLSDRFRYGFSQWLSFADQSVNASALALLIDYAEDAELQVRATMVLDLIMLDAALRSFHGVPAGSFGRSDAETSKYLESSEFALLWASALGKKVGDSCDFDQISSLFYTRRDYEVPQSICEVAVQNPLRRVCSSHGLELDEVVRELGRDPIYPRTSRSDIFWFFAGMEALLTPRVISDTLDVVNSYSPEQQRALPQLAPFRKIPRKARKAVFAALNPVTAGSALQRANVQTFMTDNYSLSSVQRYHPGEFGDQQQIWAAQLPGGISVFGTHPGSTLVTRKKNLPTPNYWVGNGILPDVAQHDNVLLAMCDLRGRKGYLEGERNDFVHFYFPAVKFDETRFSVRWVAGCSDSGYLAIIGTHPLELISEVEVVQRGQFTGYAVVLADDEEVTSMADFVRQIKSHMLTLRGERLTLASPFGLYDLKWGGDFVVGEQKVLTEYPRYASPWVNAPRFSERIEVRGSKHELKLDWVSASRQESAVQP